MKKIILIALSVFSLLVLRPQQTFATTIEGPAPHFVSDESINLSAEVWGDTFLVGQNVTISKPVNGDLYIVGEKVVINAPINGDVRVVSSTLEVKSMISGSLAFLSDQVYIPILGEIRDDAYGIADSFTLQGRIGRDLNLGYAEDADILVEGNIVGSIHYLNKMPTIADKAFVGGQLVKTNLPDMKNSERDSRFATIIGKIFHALSLMLVFMLIVRFFPQKFLRSYSYFIGNVPKNILYGLLALIVFPLILFTLFVTIIGIPLALLIMCLLMFAAYIAPLYPALYIGHRLFPGSKHALLQMLCGIFIFDVISMGPIIGPLLSVLSVIAFMGLIFKTLWDLRLSKAKS